MVERQQPTPLPGVIPFVHEQALSEPLPNRYVVRGDDKGQLLTCLEASNVWVRLERGQSVSAASAHKSPERTIYLDGAAQAEPFMDVKRNVYNLDHHEGCVRAFTLATCEQAMVMILKGLDLSEGNWTVFANEPDLDTVLAIWVLLNHLRLSDADPEIRLRAMPLIRLQGAIDAHGFELRELCGLPERLRDETHRIIDALRRHEVELKRTGRWAAEDVLDYTAQVLRSIDEVVYSPGQFEDLQDVAELARTPITKNRVAIVCRSRVGIYEVEEFLRRLHADRVGIVILQKDPSTYTIRLSDSFLPIALEPVYDRLNLLEPNLKANERWGGSSDIGGSPRGIGTGLKPKQIAEICRWVYQPPSRGGRLLALLSSTGLGALAVMIALIAAFGGVPTGPLPGLLAAAGAETQLTFSALLLALSLALFLPPIGQGKRSQHGLRRPLRLAWMALLPVAVVAAIGGGAWAAMNLASDGISWAGLLLGAAAAETFFRGLIHGRLAECYHVAPPGSSWRLSVPNVFSALLYSATVLVLFVPRAVPVVEDVLAPTVALAAAGTLVLGLACGLARERSGSLLAPVALHAAAAALVFGATLALG